MSQSAPASKRSFSQTDKNPGHDDAASTKTVVKKAVGIPLGVGILLLIMATVAMVWVPTVVLMTQASNKSLGSSSITVMNSVLGETSAILTGTFTSTETITAQFANLPAIRDALLYNFVDIQNSSNAFAEGHAMLHFANANSLETRPLYAQIMCFTYPNFTGLVPAGTTFGTNLTMLGVAYFNSNRSQPAARYITYRFGPTIFTRPVDRVTGVVDLLNPIGIARPNGNSAGTAGFAALEANSSAWKADWVRNQNYAFAYPYYSNLISRVPTYSCNAWINLKQAFNWKLKNLKPSEDSIIVLTDAMGLLISNSEDFALGTDNTVVNGTLVNGVQFSLFTSNATLINDLGSLVRKQFGDYSAAPDQFVWINTRLDSSSVNYLVGLKTVYTPSGHPFRVIAAVPRSTFFGEVEESLKKTGGMSFIISRPLNDIIRSIKEVTNFHFESLHKDKLANRNIFYEISHLQEVFHNMVKAFANALKNNQDLRNGSNITSGGFNSNQATRQ
ncbi:hypothetical protein BC829DRAFT_402402 [Chytridium lagenaria]|nr:hypothetical protein BC829DRAFT_402402 [Chytridium lagenaria]